MGRPPIPPHERKTEQVKLLFKRTDRERLELLAGLEGCPVSTLIGRWVEKRLEREHRALLKRSEAAGA